MSSFIEFRYKPQLIILFAMFFAMLSVSQVAEAKRFGAGKSFGMQKNVAPKNFGQPAQKKAPSQSPSSAQKPAAAGAAGAAGAKASGASKWLGPLAGLAVGGLLAAMIFGDGFEGIQILDILLFALIAFVLFKVFASRARKNQAHQQAYQGSAQESYRQPKESDFKTEDEQEPVVQQRHRAQPNYEATSQSGSIIGADLEDGMGQGVSEKAQFLNEIPAWFDAEQFVEGAKQHFMTLQTAWDRVDLAEIQSYCTPQLFDAMLSELEGVSVGDNRTVVDQLDAEIAAMAVDGDFFVVSIRFSGFIDEDGSGAHAFSEIWHIRRLANDEGNWLVAGIQQSAE